MRAPSKYGFLIAASLACGACNDPWADLSRDITDRALRQADQDRLSVKTACADDLCAAAVYINSPLVDATCVAYSSPFARRFAYVLGNKKEVENIPDKETLLKQSKIYYRTLCW